MIKTLKRKVRLTILDGSRKILLAEDLRIDFEVKLMIGDALNVATIDIYNLAKGTISELSSAKQFSVTLEVGSAGSDMLSVLFTGDLINIHYTPDLADNRTTLWCWQRGMSQSHKFQSNPTVYTKRTVKDIVEDINRKITDEGKQVFTINYDLASKTNYGKEINAFYTTDTHIKSIKKILGENNMIMAIRGASIFVSDAVSKEDSVDVIAKNKSAVSYTVSPLRLKKPVEFSLVEATVVYELSSDIKPLDILKIDDEQIRANLSGYDPLHLQLVEGVNKILPKTHYLIMEVTHSGSLYTDSWDTSMRGIVHTSSRRV